MVRILNVGAELEKVARGEKTTIGIENLAALILETGFDPQTRERRKLRKRKSEDVRFLEELYRLKDERA